MINFVNVGLWRLHARTSVHGLCAMHPLNDSQRLPLLATLKAIVKGLTVFIRAGDGRE